MNYNDVTVGGEYTVYQNGIGDITVLAKAIVQDDELIWASQKDKTFVVIPKDIHPRHITKLERISSLVLELKFALASPLGRADIEQNVIDVIDDLIDQIEEGTVVWHIGPKKEKENSNN